MDGNLSDIIRGLLRMSGIKQTKLVEALGLSYSQSLTTKFKHNSWNVSELYKAMKLLGGDVILRTKDGQEIVLTAENVEQKSTKKKNGKKSKSEKSKSE